MIYHFITYVTVYLLVSQWTADVSAKKNAASTPPKLTPSVFMPDKQGSIKAFQAAHQAKISLR
jgi:hypothetical protein